MEVLLISNYRPDKQLSMLRYAQLLQHELHCREFTVRVVHPPVIFGGLSFLPRPLKKWLGYIDKYLVAPTYLRRQAARADIVHICDHSNAIYLPCAGTRPALITCHDLLAVFAARGIYPEVEVGLTGRMQQRWIATHLSRAEHVICVSEKTLDDLELLAPGIRSRSTVIHHHLNWHYSPATAEAIAAERRKSGLHLDSPYLLHVGGNPWYKNRLGVLQIFAAMRKHSQFRNVRLIMAGKPLTSEMRRYCESCGLTNDVIERVGVSNEELQSLYSDAIALLFPSLEEGFGWPLLEAQACGCPVITSNRRPMTEIAGDAALYIDPDDPEQAARTIAEHVSDLSSLRSAGFTNLARFTTNKMVDSYMNYYQHVAQCVKADAIGPVA
ncbi:glycosyltransferase family 4 protein [Alloacidobacterium dinghuense]|uniref:Glycosyltransferase family 4 protein n=1 Tax=Alloacidobacterium dinghuense TaxID=2763107 RepID=A0A7G8BMP8_9BACT|nr:glycosyltransferase family 1 protein [Alloacidobacterium dinghuense]QNI33818.1 glycosyltransferase family 4 protein [Alloacidobacterium dinghuense]